MCLYIKWNHVRHQLAYYNISRLIANWCNFIDLSVSFHLSVYQHFYKYNGITYKYLYTVLILKYPCLNLDR